MMIIIIVNHHSFPVSQEPTRSNMEYFEHFPMAWSGTTVWSNWNNMQHVNTHSYWTITTVCRYRDNDVSLFSLCCCHNNWECSFMIHQQHHLVEITGKLTHQRLKASRAYPGTVEPVVNNCVSLKPLETNQQSTAVLTETLAAMWFWGCTKLDMQTFVAGAKKTCMGTTKTGLPQSLKTSTECSPKTFPSIIANIWFVVFVSETALLPGFDTSSEFGVFLISLPLPLHVVHASD